MTAVDERIRRIETSITTDDIGWRGRAFTIEERMRQRGVPGVRVAVFDAGQVEWARGWGVRGSDGGPVGAETMFQAASISKPVTAVAAMRLVECGMLGLDDDVNDRLRSWRVPAVDGRQPVVTLRQLLSHTAGLTVHGFPGYLRSAEVPSAVQILDGTEPANTPPVRVDILPGVQFRYSGGGYTVLQVLLEDVTGTPFVELMRELVLDPLGMEHSTYEQPLPAAWSDVANGHYTGGAEIPGGFYVMPELAAAGLWTTPGDLARFALGIRSALRGENDAFMSREIAERMLEPQIPALDGSLSLGFFVRGEGESRRFGHGGSNIGYRCEFVIYCDRGCGAAVMTNGDAGDVLKNEILQSVAREYGWSEFVATEPTPCMLDTGILERYVGSYELRPGWRATVTMNGSELVLTTPRQPAWQLRAVSDTEFACAGLGARVVFAVDGNDGSMTIKQSGEESVARRIG